MKRLFVFGIGGTGSRVIEALVYLLAAGVEMVDARQEPIDIIPILLDTDISNKDTIDCVAALELYQSLHRGRLPGSRGGFFSTAARSLASLAASPNGGISPSFHLNYQGVENVTFRDFVGFDQIANPRTKALLETLYSAENMGDKLTGGFLGNPNVGSVVLSGFRESADFSLFATCFSPGDRIFIINSIFGGTGAAGLPWLQKVLRSEGQRSGAATAIRESPIGALTILPYFKLQEDDDSRIDSNVFIAKTKAALSYYYNHITDLNALYYLADTLQATYANHESGAKQNNDAHLIELLGALAILQFAQIPDEECRPPRKNFLECSLESDSKVLDFASLGKTLSARFARQLTQFQMLAVLSQEHFRSSTHQPWARENGFTRAFFDSLDFRESLSRFLDSYFSVWLQQLAGNLRGFKPFDLVPDPQDMSHLRSDQAVPKHFLGPRVSAEQLDIRANRISGNGQTRKGSLARLLELWWHATDSMYRDSYEDYLE